MLVMKEISFYGLRNNKAIIYDNTQYSDEEIDTYLMAYEWGMPWLNEKKEDTIIMNMETYKTFFKLLHNNFEMIPLNKSSK